MHLQDNQVNPQDAITSSRGTKVANNQGEINVDNWETKFVNIRIVNNHGIRTFNGPRIKITSKVVISPCTRIATYMNLFNQEMESFQLPTINLTFPTKFVFRSIIIKKKCNNDFAPTIESISNNNKVIINLMCKINNVQLKIEHYYYNVQKHVPLKNIFTTSNNVTRKYTRSTRRW